MKITKMLQRSIPLLFLCFLFFSIEIHAEISHSGVLDDVLSRYKTAGMAWSSTIISYASWLFWLLATISMVWTFGFMALKKDDLGAFFAEFIRFTIFTGFFWWLLINGPNFATSIIDSLKQIGAKATGMGNSLSPSGIVDVGFEIFFKVLRESSILTPVDSMIGVLMAIAILIILALVGVNMLLLLASGWILAYGGVFFLGFGGSRWTSDMAINYYKTVLGIAASLFGMILLVGIGKTFLDDYCSHMSTDITSLKEMSIVLIVSIILLGLVNKVPSLISGIITGASVGGASGIGNFGAGAVVAAATMAAAAAATGGAALAAGASNMAGGAKALAAAFSKASENMANGAGMFSSAGGSLERGGEGGSNSMGSSTLSSAMGGASAGNDSMATKATASFGSNASTVNDGSNDSGIKDIHETESTKENASSESSRKMSKAGTVTRFVADVGANLAKGMADVAKDKGKNALSSMNERINQSTAGKVAAAIKLSGVQTKEATSSAFSFGENSLSSPNEPVVDEKSEKPIFREK